MSFAQTSVFIAQADQAGFRNGKARRDRVAPYAHPAIAGRYILGQHVHRGLGHAIGRQGGPRLQAPDGREVDDRSAAVFHHVRDGMFGTEHRAAQVDRHRAIPKCGRHVGDAHLHVRAYVSRRGQGGIVDEDVEPAEMPCRSVDRGFDILFLRDVGAIGGGGPARLSDFFDYASSIVFDDIDHGDGGAALCQQPGGVTADAATAARHDGDLVAQRHWHLLSPDDGVGRNGGFQLVMTGRGSARATAMALPQMMAPVIVTRVSRPKASA